jgi:hypothetical protein
MGVSTSGMLMQVWASESGSWSITAISPGSNMMCLLADGDGYIDNPPRPRTGQPG